MTDPAAPQNPQSPQDSPANPAEHTEQYTQYSQSGQAPQPNQAPQMPQYQQPAQPFTQQQYAQPNQNAYNQQQPYAQQQYAQQPYGQGPQPAQPYAPYGQPYGQQPYAVSTKSKLAAGLLGIFLGSLGVHNFYLGYTTKAIIQLLLTVLLWWALGLGPLAAAIWSLVEAILILTSRVGSPWHRDAQGLELQD